MECVNELCGKIKNMKGLKLNISELLFVKLIKTGLIVFKSVL